MSLSSSSMSWRPYQRTKCEGRIPPRHTLSDLASGRRASIVTCATISNPTSSRKASARPRLSLGAEALSGAIGSMVARAASDRCSCDPRLQAPLNIAQGRRESGFIWD